MAGIWWSPEDTEIFPSRMVGGAGALRYSGVLRSLVLHGDGGLQTEGPLHRWVPDELDLRDHDIVSAAKIYSAPSRVNEESHINTNAAPAKKIQWSMTLPSSTYISADLCGFDSSPKKGSSRA